MGLSLDTKCADNERNQVLLPSYNCVGYCKQTIDPEPLTSPCTDDSCTVSPVFSSTLTDDSRSDSPVPIEHANDDTAVWNPPSRYVDYLSHDWQEDDIWLSWKHIVSKRKVYDNGARLENASWRTWTRLKYRLGTVHPETLNWLKDCDVTWLYGPLETSSRTLVIPPSSSPRTGTSNSCFFIKKRPILKKRSVFNLLSLKSFSRDNGPKSPSVLSLEEPSPATDERRHIHFNDKVEQFIAVMDTRDCDDDQQGREGYSPYDSDGSSSDDGPIMMKRVSRPNIPKHSSQITSRNSFNAGSRSIELLPSTMLKYREGALKLGEPVTDQGGRYWNPRLSLSPSQASSKMLLDSDDEDADMSWEPPSVFANHEDVIFVSHGTLQQNASPKMNGCNEHSNLVRTPSGMFMPCREDEEDTEAVGLFGWVVDTVNTFKDILYVIWTV